MKAIQKLQDIENILKETSGIKYRILNNNIGKNIIVLNKINDTLKKKLEKYEKYIQEIVIENEEDKDFIERVKELCEENTSIHRNTSYISWNRPLEIETIKNVISGYSFKGGMGRSSTLAYLAYFYYFMGKNIVIIDSDFEAPGIASMFFPKSTREEKAGVLDYILDSQLEDDLNLDDYSIPFGESKNKGSMKLFSSGIDYDIENYINKISKIDFNSSSYNDGFTKLIANINKEIKPDLIFIDLRAGINESNGFILKNLSNFNFLFFNSEEQNKDGLEVVLNSLKDKDNYYILNSTIRYPDKETKEIKDKSFRDFIKDKNLTAINIEYIQDILNGDVEEFSKDEYASYFYGSEYKYKEVIDLIINEYFLPNENETINKFNEEIDNYKKAIELNPKNDNAYNNMGNAYNNQQNYDEAINNYKKAIELNPENDNAYNNMGNAYMLTENYEEAIKCYEKIKEINPLNKQAISMLNLAKSLSRSSSSSMPMK